MVLNKENLKRWNTIKEFIETNIVDAQVNISKDTIWLGKKGFAIDSGKLVVNNDMYGGMHDRAWVGLGLIDGVIISSSFKQLVKKLVKFKLASIKAEQELKELVEESIQEDKINEYVANLRKEG